MSRRNVQLFVLQSEKFSTVNAFVRWQSRSNWKARETTLALVRLLSRMGIHVIQQERFLLESSRALVAFEWLFSRMIPHVNLFDDGKWSSQSIHLSFPSSPCQFISCSLVSFMHSFNWEGGTSTDYSNKYLAWNWLFIEDNKPYKQSNFSGPVIDFQFLSIC